MLVLTAIYQNTECCVKVNSQYTGYFSVNQGLKQRYLLSPLLFNLYVNSIADDMRMEGKGVKVDDITISLLMCADDVVILAQDEDSLQCLLDILNIWCVKWRQQINQEKSQIVHLRNQSKKILRS